MTIHIVRSIITKPEKELYNRPIQQISYLGKTCNSEIFFPYGIHANLPVDSNLITFSILGQSSNKISIGNLSNKRKQLEEGEVIFYHPIKGQFIYLKNNEDIFIKTGESELTMKKDGSSILKSNLTVDGDFTSTGKILGNKVETEAGISLDDHVHAQGSYTTPSGGPVSGLSDAPQ